MNRRRFLQKTTVLGSGLVCYPSFLAAANPPPLSPEKPAFTVANLPSGNAPPPVPLPHFPDRLHAFVWRNWPLVPLDRMASAIGAKPAEILQVGRSMGLPEPGPISNDQQRRSYLAVIKRNWHLLPYDQLLALLNWTPDQMAYTLREDDFLFIKLGGLKPKCAPLKFSPPDQSTRQRAGEISRIFHQEFPHGWLENGEPLFQFVRQLSSAPSVQSRAPRSSSLTPRFCYSYFALYGDPLLEPEAEPYPENYLARLAASGVDGVWLQAVLYKLFPFPWQPDLSVRHQERLKHLKNLVERARRHGIGVYLYLNEPRSMPLTFFAQHPEVKGVTEGDHAALCTSHSTVKTYLVEAVAAICRATPDLAGFFTITASENLTSCWSHHQGGKCPRCGQRNPAEVIAEVNQLIQEGIELSQVESKPRLIAWDWGWSDAWAPDAINRLPQSTTLMSVSEWSLPIERGGIKSAVGEYSISAVGPGPRAQRHWELARKRGLKTIAKIQAGNTWELSAVPYIPAVENVARHAARLREANVDGLMLGWTLGGYPSPNLEVVAEVASSKSITPGEAMLRVATRRFGSALAPAVVKAWREFSTAFSEFPFHIGLVYSAPMQSGPSNLLWASPTGYAASMVGFPYDDLDTWRAIYPPEILIGQLLKVADGFDRAVSTLKTSTQSLDPQPQDLESLQSEMRVAEAAAIHFRSTANQARFVLNRRALEAAKTPDAAREPLIILQQVLEEELRLARRLFELQSRDSRLGFEASNQYYYIPIDLAEKVLNCRDLLDRWLPEQKTRWQLPTPN